MSSFRVFNRSVGRIISTVALVAAAVVPSFLPSLVSAAQVTGRSIALSSSSKSATNVTYDVKFTAATALAAGGAFAVDFCQESPIITDACTAPGGFAATGASVSTSGYSKASASTNRVVVDITAAVSAGDTIEVPISGITNPSAAGQFYARILTYDTSAHATGDTTAENGAGIVDTGGVALSATDTIGVSGSVLEKLIFCVGGEYSATHVSPFAAGCTKISALGTDPVPAPTLHLGTQTGSVYVLGTNTPDTGNIYTQLTTNAVGGAVVSLKNSVACGGMARLGAATCDIPALGTGGTGNGFTAGTAGFGVIANADTAADGTMTPSGALQIAGASSYSGTTYRLNGTAVTSTYGDPILDTNSSQTADRNMIITFGAQAGNNTPAGTYSANLSLVATGTF